MRWSFGAAGAWGAECTPRWKTRCSCRANSAAMRVARSSSDRSDTTNTSYRASRGAIGVDSARSRVASGSSGSRARSRAAITRSSVNNGRAAGAARRRPQLQPGWGASAAECKSCKRSASDPDSRSDCTRHLHVEACVFTLTGQVRVVIGIVVDDMPPSLPEKLDLMRVSNDHLGYRLMVIQRRVRCVEDLVAGLAGSQAKIGIVECDRQVFLVQSANLVEHFTVDDRASKSHCTDIADDIGQVEETGIIPGQPLEHVH